MQNRIRVFHTLLAGALALVVSAGCSAKAKRDRHLQSAEKYFAAGQYPKAEVEYLNALKLDQQNAPAIARLGTIYYEQGRIGRAFPFLAKACELNPNDLALHLKLGQLYRAVGKVEEARREAGFILDKAPTNAEAPLLLTETITSSNDLKLVRQRLEKLAAQVGDSASLQLAFGSLQLRQGDLQAAEAAFKRAQKLDPNSGDVNAAVGAMCLAQNDLNGAEAAFKVAAERSPARSVRRLSYADFKIGIGKLEEGKKLLVEISRQSPDFLPALIRQADIALAERDFAHCSSLLGQVLAQDPSIFEALLLKGRSLLAQTNADLAIAEFERMANLYENSPQVHYHLALARLLKGDVPRAMKSLTRTVTLDPVFPDATLLLAQLNIRQGNAAAAVASLTQLVKQRPQIFQAHLLLANAHLANKSSADALAVYERTMAYFPKSPQVPLLQGMVLAQQGRLAEARKAFEKSLELLPDFLPAFEQLVALDVSEKRFAAAQDRVRKQLEKKPDAPELHLLLANVHFSHAMEALRVESAKRAGSTGPKPQFADVPEAQAEMQQAEAAALKAIELSQNYSRAYTLLAQLYVAASKQQQALDRLGALVARTNDVAAFMQIGTIQTGLSNYTAARSAYEKLLSANPRFGPALNNLAYLYCEHLGQPDKAYEYADRARQLLPADPSTEDTLGWVLYRKGDYTRALTLLEESAGRLPAEPEIQFHLGMTHYMLGEEEPARIALQQATQAGKDFAGKAVASRRLELLAIDPKTANAATVAALEKTLADEPRDPVAAARLAAIYERDGAAQKAADIYNQALKRTPQNPQIMGRLAKLYAGSLNDPRKALALAKDAHTLAPEDASISHTLGRLVYQQGDHKWALSLLQQAAQKLADQPEVQYDLAWACYGAGRVAEAEAAMQRAFQAGPKLAKFDDATRFLAMIAAARNPTSVRQSAPEVEKILAAEPNYIPAVVVSAILQEQQGKREEAVKLYEKALAAFPLFAPATRSLALLIAQNPGDSQRAYELAVKAREAFPDDPELKRLLGILLYQRGDFSRATPMLDESAKIWTSDGVLLYYQGMTHYRLKHVKESKAALQRALNLNLPARLADDARKVLTELK